MFSMDLILYNPRVHVSLEVMLDVIPISQFVEAEALIAALKLINADVYARYQVKAWATQQS